MFIKPILRYQAREYSRPFISFFLVYSFIIGLIVLSQRLSPQDSSGNVNFVEVGSVILVFVCGIVSFRESFKFLSQNGITRKQFFVARLCSMALLSVVTSLFDLGLVAIGRIILPSAEDISLSKVFDTAYTPFWNGGNTLIRSAVYFLLLILGHMLFLALGFVIGIAYYRMNRIVKIIVSIGVPLLLFYGLPILDFVFLNGVIFRTLGNILIAAFGFSLPVPNPFIAILSLFGSTIVFFGLAWAMVRRVPVKE